MERNRGLSIPQWLVRGALIQTNQLPSHSGTALTALGMGWAASPHPDSYFSFQRSGWTLFGVVSGSGFPSHEAGQTPSSEGFRQRELWGWWKGSGEREHEERQLAVAAFTPNPLFPSSIPCPENRKCQKNLPETFDFGQSLNDKRGQETAEKLFPLLKPKYIPLAGSFQT